MLCRTSNVEILDAEGDARSWHRVLGGLPSYARDVYFWPEYVALHRTGPGTRAIMFTYSRAGDTWVYPFLLQPISSIGDHVLESTWFDIETPYGYGGPLASTDCVDFISEAHHSFTSWCQSHHVVAEFTRLHPLLQNQRWLDPQVDLVYDRETVSLSLVDLNIDDLPFGKSTCNMLRRAERLGVRVVDYTPRNRFEQFVALYLRAMERLAVDDTYYFSDSYFMGLARMIERGGWLLVAETDEQWVAVAVFLKGCNWLHYHMAALDSDKRVPGAMNLLLFTAAQMGKRHGLEQLHLGGGRTNAPDDSLLKFKHSMATGTHSFYIGKRIHDPEGYASLKQLWEKHYPSLVSQHGHRLLCYRYRPAKR